MPYIKVMLKKFILTLIAFLLILPSLSWGYGFFEITDSYIQKLDENSYRFRVLVNWEEDIMPAPTNPALEWASPGMPYFWNFELSSLQIPDNCSYNFFVNEYEGDLFPQTDPCWTAISYRVPGSLGNEFGFDFDLTGPLHGALDFSYTADISCYTAVVYDDGAMAAWSMADNTYSGSFTVQVAPEPMTLLLFGFGLAGLGIIKKYRH